MSQNASQEPGGSGGGEPTGKFHTVQALRDLESNWAVDLAKNLEEYLLKICSGEITSDGDDAHLSVNFAEAALLLQGSIQVYSRKVEYLYSLVLHALEFISQKSQQNQPEGESVQPEESASLAVPDEENDPFWGLDDIPVEAKNSLDGGSCRDASLNNFVKPPANLVVLEGDCLEATTDGGELESYLLATNDLYRDFILLDSCDALAVNDFLSGNDKARKGQNDICRGSSLTSKSRKSFQSPTRRSGGNSHKSSNGKNKDAVNRSPVLDQGFEFNNCNVDSYLPAFNSPENRNHGFKMDHGYSEPMAFDDSDDDEDDLWKPLNPHEPGNLKVKPFRKVKPHRRDGLYTGKRVSIIQEFPPAKLNGFISSEFTEIWEKRHRATDRQQKPQSLSFYEKLRQSLVLEGHESFDPSFDTNKNCEDNGYDSGDADFGPTDFDMPESSHMYEEPSQPAKYVDGDVHLDTNEVYGHEDADLHPNLEDLCRSHLDALLASIAETEKQTELAARVSSWKQRIEHNLEEQDLRPPFDIHEYGERVLDKLSLEADSGHPSSFADIVKGQQKHDVARSFSALLQLVNNGDVNLERSGQDGESTCYTAVNPFYVRLLRHGRKGQELQLRSSKKRIKSPLMKGWVGAKKGKPGKENGPVSSPSGSPSAASLSQQNSKFPVKLGNIGSARCTPKGKRRRRSRLPQPVDLNTAG